jgi:RimJ/RimL family protein N-acetyltransferase
MRLAWRKSGCSFDAIRATPAMIDEHADTLLAWYNAGENAAFMNGSGRMSRADVLDFWRDLREGSAHGFLTFSAGLLVGDMDIRGIRDGGGEFAIMIGAAASKGRGLGKAFARMLHVFAFRDLALERLYVSPRRDNARVLALEAFLGYARDDGAEAMARADADPACDTYSIDADRFRTRHEDAWREVEALR